MKEILDEHYTRLAKNYNKYLYYSPRFIRTLTSKMVEMLELKPGDIFVDLCGGTGMYSADIHRQVSFENPTYCIDAYREMLDQIENKEKIIPVHMDAMEFSAQNRDYHKVLIKEAVHHITEKYDLIGNLFKQLPPGGRLLLVHVPPEVQYPIFEKALERARIFHAKPLSLIAALQSSGFRVVTDFVDYPHKIDKRHYFDQVRSKFMSALSSFSDDEIQEGIKEMQTRYRDRETLEFIDHFDFIMGIKDE